MARIEVRLFSDRLNDLRDDFRLLAPEPHSDGLPDYEQFREHTHLIGRAFSRSRGGDSFV